MITISSEKNIKIPSIYTTYCSFHAHNYFTELSRALQGEDYQDYCLFQDSVAFMFDELQTIWIFTSLKHQYLCCCNLVSPLDMAVTLCVSTLVSLLSTVLFLFLNFCHLSRDMTKPTEWLCIQGRLRSAQASTQSDQIRVFAVRMKKAWFLSYPLSAQRRL